MNKFTLSVAALMAMNTISNAGGDIAAIQPVAEVSEPVVKSNFYVGIAYSKINFSSDYVGTVVNINDSWEGTYEEDYEAVMLLAGYKINKYFAIEGRYWESAGDAEWSETANDGQHTGNGEGTWKAEGTFTDAEFTAWGLYVKPMYPVSEDFDVYGLLGYGSNEIDYADGTDLDESGFQWGLGASYDLSDDFALFIDYVRMHSDERTSETSGSGAGHNGSAWVGTIDSDDTISTWNFGLTYKF